jgi:hypothetical protein
MVDKDKPSKFPTITHHQFMLLSGFVHLGPFCRDGVRAVQIRTWMMNRFSIAYEGPAFYQCMARMERDGLVSGQYASDPFVEDGKTRPRRVRSYVLLQAGRSEYENTIKFYKWVGSLK